MPATCSCYTYQYVPVYSFSAYYVLWVLGAGQYVNQCTVHISTLQYALQHMQRMYYVHLLGHTAAVYVCWGASRFNF